MPFDDDDELMEQEDDNDHDWQLCPCGRCEDTRANRGVAHPTPAEVRQYADDDGIVRRV